MSLEASASSDIHQPGTRRRSNVGGPNNFRDTVDSKNLSGTIAEVINLPSIPSPSVLPSQGKTPDVSEFNTPFSTRPPSPSGHQRLVELQIDDVAVATTYPDIGSIKSWRGAIILLVTCGSQLLDNVFMTGVNISLPAIQKEFGVQADTLQWLISAYTLTFGGFLLLAGVLSDRYSSPLEID